MESAGTAKEDGVSVGRDAMACLEWVCENRIWCLERENDASGKKRESRASEAGIYYTTEYGESKDIHTLKKVGNERY